jgi:hypothetical protein
MTPLERVTERALRNGNPESRAVPTPLLTLEEFFEGNDSVGSIGCNLDPMPEPGELYKILLTIRARPEVSDVRVQITCVDAPGEEWPFSDTLWIITSADAEAVEKWLPGRVAPNEVWTGWLEGTAYEQVAVPDGHAPVAIWYD